MKRPQKDREPLAIETPDTLEGMRATLRELKDSGSLKPDRLAHFEKSMRRVERLLHFNQLAWAADSNLTLEIGTERDIEALIIVGTISLNKKPNTLEGLKEYIPESEWEWHEKWIEKTQSTDPLTESFKQRIVRAVCEFDRAFLKALIAEMDHLESNPGQNRALVAIISCHQFYAKTEKRLPTNRQLLESIKEFWPGVRLDSRTLAFMCKSYNIPLSRAKLGRPKKMRK